jgi:hypothetical protein
MIHFLKEITWIGFQIAMFLTFGLPLLYTIGAILWLGVTWIVKSIAKAI